MHSTIYNIPGSQGEMMEGNCMESTNQDMETKFVIATTYEVLEALEVNHGDRRLVEPLLRKRLNDKLNHRYKREGLLQQYGSYVLEESIASLIKDLNIPDDVKPSPQGSGNGWSGWYNGWFFRSLLELSYVINVLERFNFSWESAEKNKYKIFYRDKEGMNKTYHPDFIVEEKFLVEIKPKKLYESDKVKRKKEAAITFCETNKLIYKLTTPVKTLSTKDIKILVDTSKIEFTQRYKEKFKKL